MTMLKLPPMGCSTSCFLASCSSNTWISKLRTEEKTQLGRVLEDCRIFITFFFSLEVPWATHNLIRAITHDLYDDVVRWSCHCFISVVPGRHNCPLDRPVGTESIPVHYFMETADLQTKSRGFLNHMYLVLILSVLSRSRTRPGKMGVELFLLFLFRKCFSDFVGSSVTRTHPR